MKGICAVCGKTKKVSSHLTKSSMIYGGSRRQLRCDGCDRKLFKSLTK